MKNKKSCFSSYWTFPIFSNEKQKKKKNKKNDSKDHTGLPFLKRKKLRNTKNMNLNQLNPLFKKSTRFSLSQKKKEKIIFNWTSPYSQVKEKQNKK